MSDIILSRIGKPVKTTELPKITKIGERIFDRWRIVVQKENEKLIARFYDIANRSARLEDGQFVSRDILIEDSSRDDHHRKGDGHGYRCHSFYFHKDHLSSSSLLSWVSLRSSSSPEVRPEQVWAWGS